MKNKIVGIGVMLLAGVVLAIWAVPKLTSKKIAVSTNESEAFVIDSSGKIQPSLALVNTTWRGRFPTVWVGDVLRMTITGPANAQISFCEISPTHGNDGCQSSPSWYTNSNGIWTNTLRSQTTVGPWTRWIVINGVTSQKVSYKVVSVPSAKVTISNTTSSGRFPSVQLGDQLRYSILSVPNADYNICLNGKCYSDGFTMKTNAYGTDIELINKGLYGVRGTYTFYIDVYPPGDSGYVRSNVVNFNVY